MKNKFILVFGLVLVMTLTFAKADLTIPIILSFNGTSMRIQMDNLDYSKDLTSIYNITNGSNYTNFSSSQILIGKLTGNNALGTDDLIRNLTVWCGESLHFVQDYIICNLTVHSLNETQNNLAFCNDNLSNINYQLNSWISAGQKYQIYNPSDVSVKINSAKNMMWWFVALAAIAGAVGSWVYLKKKGTTSNKTDSSMQY